MTWIVGVAIAVFSIFAIEAALRHVMAAARLRKLMDSAEIKDAK